MIDKFYLTINERALTKNIGRTNKCISELIDKLKKDKYYNLDNDPNFQLILKHFGIPKNKCIELLKQDYINKKEFSILVFNNRYHKALGKKLWSGYQSIISTDKIYEYEKGDLITFTKFIKIKNINNKSIIINNTEIGKIIGKEEIIIELSDDKYAKWSIKVPCCKFTIMYDEDEINMYSIKNKNKEENNEKKIYEWLLSRLKSILNEYKNEENVYEKINKLSKKQILGEKNIDNEIPSWFLQEEKIIKMTKQKNINITKIKKELKKRYRRYVLDKHYEIVNTHNYNLPIKTYYISTVHQTQGSTIEKVYYDYDNSKNMKRYGSALEFLQHMYSGTTRARSKLVIII